MNILTVGGKNDQSIVGDAVADDDHRRQIMEQAASSFGCHQLIMKDQDVPFDCGPSKKHHLQCKECPIHVCPEETKTSSRRHSFEGTKVVDEKENVGELIDEIDQQEDDVNIVMQCTAACPMKKEME